MSDLHDGTDHVCVCVNGTPSKTWILGWKWHIKSKAILNIFLIVFQWGYANGFILFSTFWCQKLKKSISASWPEHHYYNIYTIKMDSESQEHNVTPKLSSIWSSFLKDWPDLSIFFILLKAIFNYKPHHFISEYKCPVRITLYLNTSIFSHQDESGLITGKLLPPHSSLEEIPPLLRTSSSLLAHSTDDEQSTSHHSPVFRHIFIFQ